MLMRARYSLMQGGLLQAFGDKVPKVVVAALEIVLQIVRCVCSLLQCMLHASHVNHDGSANF